MFVNYQSKFADFYNIPIGNVKNKFCVTFFIKTSIIFVMKT